MTLRVLTVFGTRPEAIKMAPVVKLLANTTGIESAVCVTGQHREMLDQVLSLFEITPDFDLNIMKPAQDLYDLTSSILQGVKHVIAKFEPNILLVHGDTTTCFASALAAFYAGIPIGHIEAGLRTGNLSAPFPEEGNRNLVGRLACLHFAPTESSRDNLTRENINSDSIIVTGNTVIDSLLMIKDRLPNYNKAYWKSAFPKKLLAAMDSSSRKMILITGHRRENFGKGFIDLCEAIKTLALSNPSVDLVYPVHLNPSVQQPVRAILSGIENIHLIEPIDYLPFVYLMNESHFVITDSGGIQEEAPSLGKPVLVTRDVTERPEAIEAGTILLVGTDKSKIVMQAQRLLDDTEHYIRMSKAHNPYGDGEASSRIVKYICTWSHNKRNTT